MLTYLYNHKRINTIIMTTEESKVTPKHLKYSLAMADVMTDEQRWQMEQHLHNEQWESNMSNLYTYGEDGFCDGFTNW